MREALMLERALNGGPHGPTSGIREPTRGPRVPEVNGGPHGPTSGIREPTRGPRVPEVALRHQAGISRRQPSVPMNDILPRPREIFPGMGTLGLEPFPPQSDIRADFPMVGERFPPPGFRDVQPPDPVFHPTRTFRDDVRRPGLGMRGDNGGTGAFGGVGRPNGRRPVAGMRVPNVSSRQVIQGPRIGSRGRGRMGRDIPRGRGVQLQHGAGPGVASLRGLEHGPSARNTMTPPDIGPTDRRVNVGQGHNDWNAHPTPPPPQFLSDTSGSQQTVTRGDVTTSLIISDDTGVYYFFFPSPDRGGIRVNVTKDKFCNSDTHAAPRDMCVHMCYSDSQCPGHQKCCPGGCSLTCVEPGVPETGAPRQNHVTGPVNQPPMHIGVANGEEGTTCGQPCLDHLNCPGLWEYCLPRDSCGGKVCQTVV